MSNNLESLSIQFETLFVTEAPGKIEQENDPDRSSGPLFWLGGRSEENIAGVHTELADDIHTEMMALAATEPPFCQKSVYLIHYDRYISLLSDPGHIPKPSFGLTYDVPHNLECETPIHIIDSESEQGHQLEATFLCRGMAPELRTLGFHAIEDFWKPWCVALHEGEIASVAFAARLSQSGAELGLATVESLRGRGYAAAATRGWSRLPSIQSRALFYSTDQTNISSQRVIARLGLRLIGAYLRLT